METYPDGSIAMFRIRELHRHHARRDFKENGDALQSALLSSLQFVLLSTERSALALSARLIPELERTCVPR